MTAHGALHPTITLLQTSSLTSLVQIELERMILSGELAPGSKLTEVALAARLGVSRGPLREAFRMLEEAGLVRTEKNRGVFVRDIPIEEAIDDYVRSVLPGKPDEVAVLGVDTRELPVIATPQGRA